MSRFKEQRRIDAALKHQNISELQWAVNYCEQRYTSSIMKEHKKHWQGIIYKIEKVKQEVERDG